MKCPAGRKAKLPAVLLFGGFETGAQAIELLELRAPFCLLTFEYPFRPPRKLRFPGGLRYLPEAKVAIHETLEGIHKLLDWSKARLDPERLVLVGASFGAPFVSIVAGERPDVRALILAHGFADVPGTISRRLAEKWGGLTGAWFARAFAAFVWWYADIPAPEERLEKLRSHQSVFLLTAAKDDMLPASSVAALRVAVEASEAKWDERRLPGTHLRPDDTALVEELLRLSLAWLRLRGILGP